MKIELILSTSQDENQDGFILAFRIAHSKNGKETKRRIPVGRCRLEHFLPDEKNISRRHPDYDILEPIIKEYKERAKKIIAKRIDDVEVAKKMMLDSISGRQGKDFYEYSAELTSTMTRIATAVLKRNMKDGNKKLGNVKVYENAVAQLKAVHPVLRFGDITYRALLEFRQYQEALGNSKSTINHYLRTIRAIYYNGCKSLEIKRDDNPFSGIFAGLAVKSYSNKKKYIDKDSLLRLERLELTGAPARSRDFWLLQFYFGGSDLIDIYYLEKRQLRKNRVYFTRSKTSTDLMIDLAVHPKAKAIIDRYASDEGVYLFPWRKDKDGYETFRRNLSSDLKKVQEDAGIDILPTGGILGIKVARHTFQNLAKLKRLEPDLIRELVGHERDDVDNFYKDRYDMQTRDNGLFEVISSFDCTTEIFPYEKFL